MKRTGNLIEKIISSENMFLAFKEAKKGKANKRKVFDFELNLGENITNLITQIKNNTYKPKPYRKFTIREPKERIIFAPAFEDIVVQHSIYRVIYPIFEKTFITQSHGCRKNYGTHSASRYLQKSIKKYDENLYFLQLDIRKYFYSFNRDILKAMLEKKIKDKEFISLIMQFTEYEEPKGVPIGNLLSQLFGLIYLNPLDHYIKRELKIKNYVRYVDDFILIGITLDEAKEYKLKIEKFLNDNLDLTLSKFIIAKIKKGVNFVGYRTWQNYKLVRKHSMYNFKRACKKDKIKSIVSLIGHAKETKTKEYYKKILSEYDLINKLPCKVALSLSAV